MTSMTDFTIIRRSLAARLPSTIITVLLVGTSVALLLVLLGLRDAGRRAFEQGPGNMHMLVSADASPLVAVLNGVFYANAPRAPIPWATYERIRSTLPLEYAIPVVQGDSYRGIRVLATTDAFFSAFRPRQDADWVVAEGRIFARPFEVVLGARAAAASGLAIGDRIALSHGIDSIAHPDDTVRAADVHDDHAHDDHDHDDHAHDDHGHDDHAHDDHGHDDEHDHNHAGPGHLHAEFRFEVVGILAPTGGPHDPALFTDITSSWILHAHDRRVKDGFETTTADDLTEADRLITGIYVRVLTREGRMMSGAQQQVFDQLRRDPTLTVADPAQEIGRLFEIVGHIDDILLAMAAAVMGSSGFAILLALYNSMAQRRRQIAVLRVLGASRRRIFGLVLTESALLGWFGVIVGVVASWAGAAVVAGALRARLGLVVEPSMDLRSTLLVGIGTIVLAVVAGFAPAIMAYRTAVVEHLRPLD